MDTRREFIRKAALLSGGTGLFSKLPASIQRAMAINPQTGSTWQDAEHIVLLMQENRSFDHCFGTLRGVRGFNDPRAISLPNKNPVWLQTNAAGETYAPFRLNIKDTKATWMHSLPHSWTNQTDARNEGKFDKWLDTKKSDYEEYAAIPMTMGYYTREDIPFYYALADAFTVCDQHFCSSLTGTTPNRLFFWTGTIRERQDENSYANVWNENVDYGSEVEWPTFPEKLEENGISWKIYQNEISIPMGLSDEEDAWLGNFGDSPLQWFLQYNVRFSENYIAYINQQIAVLPKQIEDMEQQVRSLPQRSKESLDLKTRLKETILFLDTIKEEQKKYTRENFEKLSQHEKNLHEKAFCTNKKDPFCHDLTTLRYDDNGTARELQIPKGDIFQQFREDVKTGNLPTVSWLVAPERFSDHPSSAWYGAWYISETLDILTQNPEVWKKTIFILTYDENDGYFDHVPPFVAPDPRKPGTGLTSKGIDTRVDYVTLEQEIMKKDMPVNKTRESSIGLGFRVPLVIASPWSRGGWVNSQVFDHTSCLQFLENFLSHKLGKKIEEQNISAWRRTVCGDLTSVFRPYNGEKIDNPAFISKDIFIENVHKAQFKNIPTDYKRLTPAEIEQAMQDRLSAEWMPEQEKGTRPSCPLPYQLRVNGRLSDDKKSFEIKFEAGNEIFGDKSAGSPFNVYAPGKYRQHDKDNGDTQDFEAARTWAYAITAGDQLSDSWALQHFENEVYHLRVYGPNGFYREFIGHGDDPPVDIDCSYQHGHGSSLTGSIELRLQNKDSHQRYTMEIKDNAYKSSNHTKTLEPGAKAAVLLATDKSSGWYDFSVRVTGIADFEKRYAGRVETGKAGYSDPALGR